MTSVQFIGITCEQCDEYYLTRAETTTTTCPCCENEIELIICENSEDACKVCDHVEKCEVGKLENRG